jgi:hypothetical protein
MTLEVILTRDVDLQEYRAVMEISRTEKRDDILSVLKLVDETRGPISADTICRRLLAKRPQRVGENIIRRLTELGLLYNRRLSEKGRDALERGQVFMPERGSYRVLCARDYLLPQVILDLKEEDEKPSWSPSRKEKEGADAAVRLPKWLKETEGKIVQLLGRKGETIRVEKLEERCIPLGLPGGKPLRISLALTMGGHTELSVSERFARRLPPPDLTFEDVWPDIMGDRVDDWSEEYYVEDYVEENLLLCDFDDLSDSDRRNFTTNLEITNPELPIIGKFKRTVVRNVPVAPRSLEDAQRWAEWLLVETLSGYLSDFGYEEHVGHVDGYFPWYSVYLPPRERKAGSILEEWQSQEREEPLKPQYWYLRAPIDLDPGGD